MNKTGYYHFRCWRNAVGRIVGQQLSIFEYQAWINEGWRISGFDGRRGVVCILTDDLTITRLELLSYTICFMEGNLVTLAIDLENFTSTIEPVIPPP